MKFLPSQNLRAFILQFLKPYKFFALGSAALAILTGLWGPINSLLLKHIIDCLAIPEPQRFSVWWLAIFFVLNLQIHELCFRGIEYLNCKFQPVIKNKIISITFGYVHEHAHQFFQDHLAGRISSQINTLADNIERIVHDLARPLIRLTFSFIVSLVTMYCVHLKFFLALLTWFVIFSFFSLRMSARSITLSQSHADAESVAKGKLVDSITNASTVRIFARRIYEISYLNKALSFAKSKFQSKQMLAIKILFFQGVSISVMLGFVLYLLIQLRMDEKVSVGDFALILGLSVDVCYMVGYMLEQVGELNKAVGKCKDSLLSLFRPLAIIDQENAFNLSVANGQIAFSKVTFHHNGVSPIFLKKSVIIEAGQKVGLVGYSGSGKSTFVHLILRLYDIDEGQILIDGQNIRECTQDSLRGNIAMIPQDPSLFHRSLMENIRYAKLDATDQEVMRAAKRAHAHEFIIKLPQGYESLVGDRGIKLSGGQRQRISIARAILKNAPILILDEATSALDSVTENEIQESLWQLMQGKTTLVIAHRLSTLSYMDRILVFDQGNIVQDGSHKELLKSGGLYKSFWDAQVDGVLPNKKADMHSH